MSLVSLINIVIEFSLSIDGPLVSINGPVIPILISLAPTFAAGYCGGRLARHSHRLQRNTELEGSSVR